MKIYIDTEYHCHVTNPEGSYREMVEDFFDGKCQEFVEGYLLKPDDETWIREDGKIFSGGKMITSWKSYPELDAIQRKYEQQQFLELQNEKNELITSYAEGVNSI